MKMDSVTNTDWCISRLHCDNQLLKNCALFHQKKNVSSRPIRVCDGDITADFNFLEAFVVVDCT